MRCNNCGWNNPENVTKCQKCNQELVQDFSFSDASPEHAVPVQNSLKQTVIATSSASTQPIKHSLDYIEGDGTCPKCGYPLSVGVHFCPNCGLELNKNSVQDMNKTVMDSKPVTSNSSENGIAKTVMDSDASVKTLGISPAKLAKTVREVPDALLSDSNDVVHERFSESLTERPQLCRLIPMENFDGKVLAPIEIEGTEFNLSSTDLGIDNPLVNSEMIIVFTYSDGQLYLSNKAGSTVYVSTSNTIKINKGDIIVIGNRRFSVD